MDPWEKVADEQIVSPIKARMRAAETRRQRKLEKEKQDRDVLFSMWKKWHEERKQQLIDGPHSDAARRLTDFLEIMTIEDGPRLIKLIQSSPLRKGDPDTKFITLSLVSLAICYLRERVGLYPFDDPLLDEEPDVFQLVKEMLR